MTHDESDSRCFPESSRDVFLTRDDLSLLPQLSMITTLRCTLTLSVPSSSRRVSMHAGILMKTQNLPESLETTLQK